METKDKSRKWMWWFLGAVAAFQLYFVWELVAALALFALGFVVLTAGVAGIYLLYKGSESAFDRLAGSGHPAVVVVKRGMSRIEEVAVRQLRRPGSEPIS
jgi:hypothetical protein